ncbi:MAG: addiction module protein [Methanophagales archaeon]|nr:addiction module protein [Methanophagales archaeon]
MIALAEKVYEEALDLPTDDRLKLIDKLLHSTNLPIQMDIDKAWALEVDKRSKQIEEGTAKLIPGEEVFLKIKNRLAQ